MNQEKIGMLIAATRKEKNLTQEQLAQKLGLTNKAISKWEKGKCLPDVAVLPKLCDILGITVTSLLKGEEGQEEQLIYKLLGIIERLKKLPIAIMGLLTCCFGFILETMALADYLEDGIFAMGFFKGCVVGIKLIGVAVTAYGLIMYNKKLDQDQEQGQNQEQD